ncbi:hypothetical protein C8D87_11610 [Lentzea atacamensis]|uniref:Uncharacterized protein n=1 Tax=Lentzea atacamensis TaxID=531938 RepID=A0ABX9DV52_9PSEU|nr:hypothetical protein [Lentzea atacamensis]RAS58957.1 hypothetical protein C8D87_11610 [Lentzea atacamensis]
MAERYIREIYESLKYWATWLPGIEIEIGDYGPINGFVFKPEGNVRDRGIKVATEDSSAISSLSHKSKGSVAVTFQVAADMEQKVPGVPTGKAGIGITFSQESAVAFSAVGCQVSRAKDVSLLERQVLDGGESWLKDGYVVVTQVVRAKSATVMMSTSRDAEFVASASADLTAGFVDIGNASLSLTSRVERNVNTALFAKKGVTPLFSGIRFDERFWSGWTGVPMDLASGGGQPSPFAALTPKAAERTPTTFR